MIVIFEGKKITLQEDARLTGRQVSDGHFEMVAKATDELGVECLVYWEFEEVEGKELDEYNYDKIDRVEKV